MVSRTFFLLGIPAGHLKGGDLFLRFEDRADQFSNELADLSKTAGAAAKAKA
jgi:hypothetical protein